MTIEVKVYCGLKYASGWIRHIADLVEQAQGNDAEYVYVSVTKEDPTKRDC